MDEVDCNCATIPGQGEAMAWRFWKPLRDVESVATQLAEGLRNGSIVLDEPFADEISAKPNDVDEIDLQTDFPTGASEENKGT